MAQIQTIEHTISIPKHTKQSLSFLKDKILKNFPLLRPIKNKRPLMTTLQYEAIYPYVAQHLFQNINLYDVTIEHYIDYDSRHHKLNGFTLFDNKTWKAYNFIFTYEGIWLIDNQPLEVPNHVQEYINKLVCNSYECLIYNKSLTKENFTMNNIERLQMEITGIELPHEELLVYLKESGLDGYTEYNASSKVSKRAIYETALSILHSIANQPHLMKNYKQDDMTVSDFSKQLQNRINQLEIKVRQMPKNDANPSNFFNLFQ
ncbi:glutathionylspermidine synthase [Niallia circulans]|uniref:glutathionylspermidine synthase n=1 Tax=Niallia circulans TaxID=1397 RepID=UPI002E225FCE|nr:glutathionylspermidine synthase [Niallia circulans]